MSVLKKATTALVLTAMGAAGSILMVGPQILVIVPAALGAGVVLAIRRSFWSLVCFGYPLTFGLISAWIGSKEIAGYGQTTAFAVSIGVGILGAALIATGAWKALAGTGKQADADRAHSALA